jgi:UDP-2-acetamido-2,6-beta-L-arabino-hexul-4-ose reductase
MEVVIREISVRRDARGCVFEPLSGDELPYQQNVHVVLTLPGEVRGNHHHAEGTETLVVYGPALVRHRAGGEVIDTVVPEDGVVRFTFPPGVPHAVENTGSRPGLLIAFNTEIHDAANPDTVWAPLLD